MKHLPSIRLHPKNYSTTTTTRSYGWNLRLRSLSATGDHHSALALYRQMLHPPNPHPDAFTFPFTFPSAAALSNPSLLSSLHSHALQLGCLPSDPFVLSSLLSSYSRLSFLPLARQLLLHSLPHLPSSSLLVPFNALISAHSHSHSPRHALHLFVQMRRLSILPNYITFLSLFPSVSFPSPLHAVALRCGLAADPSIANCLLTSYSKSGSLDAARELFDEMGTSKDVVSWNAVINAYAQNGLCHKVLELYKEMKKDMVVKPDAVTLVGVLSSCANLGARSLGREVERVVAADPCFAGNVFVTNGLINMHARCGDLARARELFDEMGKDKTIVSWTAIIAGYGMHGHGRTAVGLFEKMLAAGVRPDGIAMVSVLSACSHAGLTDEGLSYFDDMERVHGIVPGPEHYACMVDLLGRAGRLKAASEMIELMKVEPDGAVWGALLGACKIHKNMELGEVAFQRVIELEPGNVGYYVLLSNIYTDAGLLDGVARVRAMMRKQWLRKDPGCSYVEHKGRIHLFMADDHSHPHAENIYEMIRKLEALSKEGEEGTARVTGFHSERLAVAFSILNTEAGEDIVVIKNLRVCEDCHLFMKLVSGIVHRKVVIRDASRFHHFEGGVCSCNDYW